MFLVKAIYGTAERKAQMEEDFETDSWVHRRWNTLQKQSITWPESKTSQEQAETYDSFRNTHKKVLLFLHCSPNLDLQTLKLKLKSNTLKSHSLFNKEIINSNIHLRYFADTLIQSDLHLSPLYIWDVEG